VRKQPRGKAGVKPRSQRDTRAIRIFESSRQRARSWNRRQTILFNVSRVKMKTPARAFPEKRKSAVGNFWRTFEYVDVTSTDVVVVFCSGRQHYRGKIDGWMDSVTNCNGENNIARRNVTHCRGHFELKLADRWRKSGIRVIAIEYWI